MEKRRVPAPSKPFWLHQNSTSWKEARVIQEESKKLQTTLQTTFFPFLGTWLIPYPLVSSEDKYFTAQEIRTLITCLLLLDHLHQQEVPTILLDSLQMAELQSTPDFYKLLKSRIYSQERYLHSLFVHRRLKKYSRPETIQIFIGSLMWL